MSLPSRIVLPLAVVLLLAAVSATAAPVPAVVSPAWLAEQLAAAPVTVVVIDARPSLKAYLAAHLPGAQPLVVDSTRSASGGVPAVLFPWETLHLVIHRLGISRTTPVVVYAEQSDIDATYVADVLRISGVAQVSVLDGGFARWTAEKRPVTTERKFVSITSDALVPDARSLVGLEEVLAAVEKKSALLLDVRPAESWAAGHIPGAKHRFWAGDVVAAGQPGAGTFRADVDIRADFEALGITKETPVIVYCNSGHQASEAFFMLKYQLGYPNVKLYLGSWIEWSMTPGTPKEVASPAATAAPAKG
ncbi:MAG: sulfurtransferase [Holophagales bacterium]|jgi:thiosulfate/3-mercaptopyruvate sulfurtransferase|nr:sulfurtransferase [Holophagales bacterium]MBK9966888.1 sulfurtransferase [Holophagales bacterium]